MGEVDEDGAVTCSDLVHRAFGEPNIRFVEHERWVLKLRPVQVNGAHATEFLSLGPVLWTPHTESNETVGRYSTDK